MNTLHTGPLELRVTTEKLALSAPFQIAGYQWDYAEVILVELASGPYSGVGEASGVYYLKESADSMRRQIESKRGMIEAGVSRDILQSLLPPGGARNALDCALWDLEAKITGHPVWEMAGLEVPHPLLTTFTCAADTPDKMADMAKAFGSARALKLKLMGDSDDAERVRVVRAARDDVWLAVDANQSLTRASLEALLPVLTELGVALIEQPVPAGKDSMLAGLVRPIPIAADESVQSLSDIARLVGLYDVINIKLDKCGGLTEGLAMVRESRRLGFKTMIGNMFGSSLAMAPGFLVGQLCDVVDLDAPVYLKRDRDRAVRYTNGFISCPGAGWGNVTER